MKKKKKFFFSSQKVFFLENKGHIIQFKCMNLVDAFIQSNIYYIEGIHFISSCMGLEPMTLVLLPLCSTV